MSQNLVIPGADNKVVYVFGGIDLTSATNIEVQFGAESYSLANDPLIVIVTSATELSLNLSATLEVGKVFSTVKYFDGASVLGTDITSQELGNSDKIIVAIGTQIIVEDGSQVTSSNSFVSDAEYKAYANLRGLTVAATQPDREAHLIAAMDYLHALEVSMQGTRASSTQALMYPRYNVLLYGYLLASDKIPTELKQAQMEAAAYSTSNSLQINSEESNLASFSVDGAYSESYHEGGSRTKIRLDSVNGKLAPLLNDTNRLVRT